MNIELFLEKNIEKKLNTFSKRFLRFCAIYYPNANIRRVCWMKTNVILGQNTFLNPNVIVSDDYLTEEVLLEIGSDCSISPGVVFAPLSSHNNSKELRTLGILEKFEKKSKIIIGDDVWIGANSTILSGIRIGKCSIIGANSLVNKDIPDYSLAYGVPIQIIKDLRN
jgi:acetyltransferase-like isoleucine patch superfamily enzyme